MSHQVNVLNVPFPDFMTSARRELMLSAVFFDFFTGAIVTLLPLQMFDEAKICSAPVCWVVGNTLQLLI